MHLKVEKYLLHDELKLYVVLYTGVWTCIPGLTAQFMFRWPAPALKGVLWWRMCLCPIWRQTSQSSDTLEKNHQKVCFPLSLQLCVCAVPRSKVIHILQCSLVHVERSPQGSSGLLYLSVIQRYACYQHNFYSVFPATARSHLTALSSTDVFK